MSLTEQICDKARNLGFDLVGIAPAHPVPQFSAYHSWLSHGYHGEMEYMARPDRVARRKDPNKIVPGARSVICVGLNYYPGALPHNLRHDPSRGLISNYAWGVDYHDLMRSRLQELVNFAETRIYTKTGRQIAYRVYVDTGPVLERAYAVEAGLGFIGKNTCLIHPQMGSWLFLGEILLDVELDYVSARTPRNTDVNCGSCRRCLDACPTGALIAPYVLDARRCISYLTIELKGPIPHELRPLLGNWIYGCDICQTVCPWQRFARPTRERSFYAQGTASPPSTAEGLDRISPVLSELVRMNVEAFQRQYTGTPLHRTGRHRLLRNALVALGNQRSSTTVPTLTEALADEESLVRGHAAWALGQVGGQAAQRALENVLSTERDPYARHEILAAIDALA